ncbi:MAG: cytochrome c-type biogenesis protein CcmH [Rhodospirillales bacterium]|jgi:cytochrome c-type biogenesis protein CcmH|nr:cytochrome c-type biogenesis protein CcmH [Rhodospirillales bacterium]
MRAVLLIVAALLLPLAANAVEPSEVLSDPVLETRARDISENLRCLVCQNQSIDESDAQLARDLRVLVRERLVAGSSDGEVIDYVVSRYGDFVLLNPPFKGSTYVLWLGPAAILGLGLMGVFVFFRRRAEAARSGAADVMPLSAEENKRLQRILDEAGK